MCVVCTARMGEWRNRFLICTRSLYITYRMHMDALHLCCRNSIYINYVLYIRNQQVIYIESRENLN